MGWPPVERVASIGSTNAALAERERVAPQPEGTALATMHQAAGRGRLGREWSAPPGASLAVSVVLRPRAPRSAWGWIPLLGGLAALRAVAAEVPRADIALKWPNDVLVGERKVAGVLAEAVGDAVVLGVGINIAMTADELPVPAATSIAIEGGDPGAGDRVLSAWLESLAALVGTWDAAGGDAEASGIREAVEAALGTIGRDVRVELPDGSARTGPAGGLDPSGALVVGGAAILAGDVEHLRYQ